MLMIVLEVIFWVVFIYGFLSLAQDIINEITYAKINHDMKIIVFARNIEEKIDDYINEFCFLKKGTNNKSVTVIDFTESEDIDVINKKLKNEEINWKFLNLKQGKEFIENHFINFKN